MKKIFAACLFLGALGSLPAYARSHDEIFQQIVRDAQSIHPADRQGYINTRARDVGLVGGFGGYTRVVYSNISRGGGVNQYTARDFTGTRHPSPTFPARR